MAGAPGSIGFQILAHAPVGVIHAAVKHQLGRPGIQPGEGHLTQKCNRVVVEFAPARRIEIKEKAGRVVIPTPPEIAGQGPETLLQGSNEAIERTGLAHDRRHLACRLRQFANVLRGENAGLDSLNHQNALQDAAINQGNA